MVLVSSKLMLPSFHFWPIVCPPTIGHGCFHPVSDSLCIQKPLLQLAQTMRISYFKGKSGTTKVTVFSLAFLCYFGEKTKSDGFHKFSITLCYFTAFQTRETWSLWLTKVNGVKVKFIEYSSFVTEPRVNYYKNIEDTRIRMASFISGILWMHLLCQNSELMPWW